MTIVPEPRVPSAGPVEGLTETVRVINQNFRKFQDLMQRAILGEGGGLIADGSILERHLSTDAKTLLGDVTGTVGASGSTTVEKIRGKGVDAPAAGDDAKVLAYNHANADFDWVDVLRDVLTTRGDLLVRGASAEGRLSVGGANTVLKSDGTDPGWGTVTGLLDTLFGSSQGSVLYRGAATWAALGPGTSGHYLKTQGAGANPLWAAAASTFLDLTDTPAAYTGQSGKYVRVNAGETALEFNSVAGSSPLTTKGDLYTFDSADARLPVGSDYTVLQSKATETTGLRWRSLSDALDDTFSSTQGSILYRGGAGWAALGPGTSGDFLKTQGAGANPTWAPATTAAHNVLSTTHGDATTASVVRGDLLYGNSTPKWDRLALGTRRYLLSNDGTDVTWDDPKRFLFPRYYSILWAVFSSFNNIATSSAGAMSVTESGTRADGGDSARPSNKWTNATTTAVGIRTASNSVLPSWYPYFHASAKLVDNNDGVTWIGFLNTTTAPTTDNPGVACATFRAANTTDTNFRACLHDGVTFNPQDTGVAIDGNWHEFEINTPDGGTTWNFYIDGTLTNALTTNAPSAAGTLCGFVMMGAKSSTAREIRVSHASIICNTRPTV